jgi:hypothetical protein
MFFEPASWGTWRPPMGVCWQNETIPHSTNSDRQYYTNGTHEGQQVSLIKQADIDACHDKWIVGRILTSATTQQQTTSSLQVQWRWYHNIMRYMRQAMIQSYQHPHFHLYLYFYFGWANSKFEECIHNFWYMQMVYTYLRTNVRVTILV